MAVINRYLFHHIFGDGAEHVPAPATPARYTGPADRGVLLALARTFQPLTVLEIGCQEGATAALLLRELPGIAHYIGIDVPPAFRPALDSQKTEVPKAAGYLAAADPRFDLRLPPGGTADLTPFDLPQVDLVYIDADHSLDGVTRDSALARAVLDPQARHGSVIIWHDYVSCPGVRQYIDTYNRDHDDPITLVNGTWCTFQILRACDALPAAPVPSALPSDPSDPSDRSAPSAPSAPAPGGPAR